jgi:adenylate cyclase
VALLDRHFEAVVKPILDQGGEVLKFIGDGVLAAFPAGPQEVHRAPACRRAVAAGMAALSAIEEIALPGSPAPAGDYAVASHLGAMPDWRWWDDGATRAPSRATVRAATLYHWLIR